MLDLSNARALTLCMHIGLVGVLAMGSLMGISLGDTLLKTFTACKNAIRSRKAMQMVKEGKLPAVKFLLDK